MCKVPISHEELTVKVLTAVQAHQGCEFVKEVAITPVEIVGSGMTWHANLVDSGSVDWQLAASVLRKARDDLEPMFALLEPRVAKGR